MDKYLLIFRSFLLKWLSKNKIFLTFVPFLFIAATCELINGGDQQDVDCLLVQDGYGPAGTVEIITETVVTGLEVPWAIAFLPNGDALVTERGGRLRLVTDIYNNPQLMSEPVATFETASTSEGGLLGLELHPDFENNRLFYIYVTVYKDWEWSIENRVERWQLSEDGRSAQRESLIYEEIVAANIHNGGRIKFGPDGMLYVGTGDAGDADLSQVPASPNGKLLRLTPEGEVPDDNPEWENPVFISGIRNTQGWAWPDENNASTVWLVDHGPSGEMLRFGHDEVNIGHAGDNLGWPNIYGCEEEESLKAPILTWEDAVPPGGADIYTGDAIPEWEGSLIIGTLRSKHLHRVVIQDGIVENHEVYLQDEYGRIRDVAMGDDGELYITTSNCDGRGTCPGEKDKIIRITR